VSPWSRKALRVVVRPDRVSLQPVRRRLSLRGLDEALPDPRHVPCAPTTGGPPWRAALQALEAALPAFRDGREEATVVLSNHFLRYALVPWNAQLAGTGEEEAYTRHCFTRVYGPLAEHWVLRLSHELADVPRLASALDGELLDGLRGVFEGAGVALASIQPQLMTVFNDCRGHLRHHSGWLALLEPGNLCLALLERGRWSRIRNLRIADTWREALPLILEREAYLADRPVLPREVFLWHAEADDAAPPQRPPWTFRALASGAAAAAAG
jgi:hypothetical protein